MFPISEDNSAGAVSFDHVLAIAVTYDDGARFSKSEMIRAG